MPRRPLFITIAVLTVSAICRPAPSAGQLGAPVEAFVSVPPRPVRGANEMHLVYELHLTNFGRRPLTMREVAISAPGAPGPLARFGADQLNEMIRRPGLAPDAADRARIDGGMRGVALMWITLPNGDVPSQLVHRITVAGDDDSVTVLAAPTVTVGPEAAVIGPPLRGANWFAANGPHNETGHRRSMIPLDGRVWIAQRFAIDWVQVQDGSTFSGEQGDNASYHAWGDEALAVADGIIASIKDGIPENVPGVDSRAVPITLETVGGNFVIIDIGSGQYAFYAHLQPGSLRVAVGDRVRRGDVVGLVGNSGNSTEPHLHFHISDGNSPLASEGLPYAIDEFDVQGSSAGFGSEFDMFATPERRTHQIPMANELVRFNP